MDIRGAYDWPELTTCPACGAEGYLSGPIATAASCPRCGAHLGHIEVAWTHYQALGVPADAPEEDIVRAVHAALDRLSEWAKTGPEGPVRRALLAINAADRVLTDAVDRAFYDVTTSTVLGAEGAWTDPRPDPITVPRPEPIAEPAGTDLDLLHSFTWLRYAVRQGEATTFGDAGPPQQVRRWQRIVMDAALSGQRTPPEHHDGVDVAIQATYNRLTMALARCAEESVPVERVAEVQLLVECLWAATCWQWQFMHPSDQAWAKVGPPPARPPQVDAIGVPTHVRTETDDATKRRRRKDRIHTGM